MPALPQKIATRIADGLKRFQPIVESAKVRDVNESDTVVLLTGILSEILGYDKYTDITTEMSIRGTYCDLALKINGNVEVLLEAKAIGLELKEAHVKQAVDYAANKGIDWVILSNGVNWKVFKILFTKPIQNILVFELDFLKLNHKSKENLECMFVLTKEAVSKDSLEEFYTQKQATNKYMLGNLLTQDNVLATIKKELKAVYPDIKVTNEEISAVLLKDVIKREILEGEESDEAKKKINKAFRKKERSKMEKPVSETSVNPVLESSNAEINEVQTGSAN
jgi:predicted type IV restriction endonuclease